MLNQLLKSGSKKLEGEKNDIKLHNSYTLIITIGMGSSSTATQKIIVRKSGSLDFGRTVNVNYFSEAFTPEKCFPC